MIQRLQLASQGDALFELPQFRGVQDDLQLRLAHEHNLQKLLLRSFEVGQQPDLLQQLVAQRLCLVHNKSSDEPAGVALDEKAVQVKQHLGLGPASVGQAQ